MTTASRLMSPGFALIATGSGTEKLTRPAGSPSGPPADAPQGTKARADKGQAQGIPPTPSVCAGSRVPDLQKASIGPSPDDAHPEGWPFHRASMPRPSPMEHKLHPRNRAPAVWAKPQA